MPKQYAVTNAPEGYGNLVLTRKAGESINIGDGLIKVTLMETRGDKARIMITAPRELNIVRSELEPETK